MTQTTAAPKNVDSNGVQHALKWFVYSGGEKLRHTSTMRGHWPGWDVECSCGWKTNTGGAIRQYIRNEVWGHKWENGLHKFQREGI